MQPPQAPPNSQTHKLGLPKSPPPLLLIFGLDYRHGAVLERISVGIFGTNLAGILASQFRVLERILVGIFGVRLVGVLERIWWGFLLHDLVGTFASTYVHTGACLAEARLWQYILTNMRGGMGGGW